MRDTIVDQAGDGEALPILEDHFGLRLTLRQRRDQEPALRREGEQGARVVDEIRGFRNDVRDNELSGTSIFALFPQAAEPIRKALAGESVNFVSKIKRGDKELPPIKAFYGKRAGFLSGGQQQMVSIGRTLLSQPRCLMMDEPSIGLAPKLFQDMLQPIRALQREANMAVILVEQNVREALKISDRVVVMKAGQVILDAVPEELSDNTRLMQLY